MQIDNEKLLINLMEKRKIFWEPIVAAALLLLAVLGVMVPLYVHSDNANRAQIDAIRKDIKEFHEEIKDINNRMYALEMRRNERQ